MLLDLDQPELQDLAYRDNLGMRVEHQIEQR